MKKTTIEQKPTNPLLQEILPQLYITTMFEDFLNAKKVEGLSQGTLSIYYRVMTNFINYCDTQLIKNFTDIDAPLIRNYMNNMEENGHNPGGRHQAYRVIRTFVYWCVAEEEDSEEMMVWRNPYTSKRLKAPKLVEEPLEPVPDEDIKKMMDSCDNTIRGLRNKAILMILTDTGVRVSELTNMMLTDVDWRTRTIVVTHGKGGKPRSVFFCNDTKKALVAYLRKREDIVPNLFATYKYKWREAGSISYTAMRDIIRDIAKAASVPTPTLHSFRRTFAITTLRNGIDIFTLQRLMGHADLQVLRRYLRQTTTDLKAAHDKFSPVASMKKRTPYS